MILTALLSLQGKALTHPGPPPAPSGRPRQYWYLLPRNLQDWCEVLLLRGMTFFHPFAGGSPCVQLELTPYPGGKGLIYTYVTVMTT